jgi:hypothetical protein
VNERDFVIVEGDRGEDLGLVVEVISMYTFLERRMNRPPTSGGGGNSSSQQQQQQEDQNIGCILRLATLHERQLLPDKFHSEKDVVVVRSYLLIVFFLVQLNLLSFIY